MEVKLLKDEKTSAPEFYLKHKDYFDEKIITVLEDTNNKYLKEKDKNGILQAALLIAKKDNMELRRQLSDTKNYNKFCKQLLKDAKADKNDLEKRIDDLAKTIDKIEKEKDTLIDDLIKELEIANKEIERLKRENEKNSRPTTTKKNSTNSNLPPSTDFSHKKINSRVKTGKKVGGQINHPGHFIKPKTPNSVKVYHVKSVPKGALPHVGEDGKIDYYYTQELDSSFSVVVSETQYILDPNGEDLPKEVLNKYKITGVSYGKNIKSLVLLLNIKGTVPLKRLCEIINEYSNNNFNLKESTICNWNTEFHAKTKDFRQNIISNILRHNIIHVDETSSTVNGKVKWVQCLTNKFGTYYFLVDKRGDNENGVIKKLENFSHYVVHDHFKPYYKYLEKAIHCECGAHILRYLKAGYELEGSFECSKLMILMREMLKEKKKLLSEGKNEMEPARIEDFKKRYKVIIESSIDEFEKKNPGIKKKYIPDYIKLFKRMLEYIDKHFAFLLDFNVPFDNNEAERACRKVKNKKKTSTQFRDFDFAHTYFENLSVFETLNKNHENIYNFLTKTF